MKKYILENYEDQLNHQVIHMDQGVCYCPEFLASRKMHDYPSRKLQLARAVFKGDLPANDYIGGIVFSGILSREGERWQNFRENPEDCTDVMILSRAMLRSKGYQSAAPEQLKALLQENGGHINKADKWDLPTDPASDTAILLDDAAAEGFAAGQDHLAAYCRDQGISFINEAEPVFLGFEYFACGQVEEGTTRLSQVVQMLKEKGASKVLTISAQAYYMLKVFAGKLGIDIPFEVSYLPDLLGTLEPEEPAYVYGGSFNLRYLCNGDQLNDQIRNSKETPIKESAEFIPLLEGDRRVNKLTIWQRPVGPEYACFGTEEKILEMIKEMAATDIRKAAADYVVSYEPTAMAVLQENLKDKRVVSYLELL